MIFFFLILYVFALFSLKENQNNLQMRTILLSVQTFGVLTRFTNFGDDSSSLGNILLVFDLSNMNLEAFFSLECFLFEFDFWDSFTLKSVSLLFVFVIMYLTGLCSNALSLEIKCRKRKRTFWLALLTSRLMHF
jgi:hypothetical protein